MILIDIKKAYDSVNLDILKNKIFEIYREQNFEDKRNMEIVFGNIIDIYKDINMIINNDEVKNK